MRKKLIIGAGIFVGLVAVLFGLLWFLGPVLATWPYTMGVKSQLRGRETTPEEFEKFEEQWRKQRLSHYRLVVEYRSIDPDISPGCRQDLEIKNESILMEFENTCSGLRAQPISSLFHMFKRFVGSGPTRPPASNGCSYYIVDAVFDPKLGYPQFLKTILIHNITERRKYFSWETEFDCLMIGSPVYGVEVISLTELPEIP